MDVISEKQKNGKVKSSKLYRGHTFNVFINKNNKTEGKIFIKGVDFSGKEFKVCTPIIQFKNGNKITNIQHRYLEFF